MDFVYLNLRILKLDDIFTFELGKFMHQHHKNVLPNSFSDYFQELATAHQRTTRASVRGDIKVIRCNKAIGQRSLRYQGAKLWNTMSSQIRSANKTTFKSLFRNYIFSKF